MTIQTNKFLFDNQSSDEFGLWGFVSFDNSSYSTNDEETEIIMSKNSFQDQWNFHGRVYNNPLTFTLTICKSDGGFIDPFEQRSIKKWLCKNKLSWLQVVQNELENVYFRCIINNPRMISINRMNAGMSFTVTCDAPYPWSGLYSYEYICEDIFNFNLNNIYDFEEYVVYPTVTIEALDNGDISITNNTVNQSITIKDCTNDEKIILDRKGMISSSKGILIDRWNKRFLEVVEGENSITLSGNFNMKLEYRLPIRVGG